MSLKNGTKVVITNGEEEVVMMLITPTTLTKEKFDNAYLSAINSALVTNPGLTHFIKHILNAVTPIYGEDLIHETTIGTLEITKVEIKYFEAGVFYILDLNSEEYEHLKRAATLLNMSTNEYVNYTINNAIDMEVELEEVFA